MKKAHKYFFMLSLVVLLLIPAMVANAASETITGKVTGITCLLKNYMCPVDKADPMINLETDFVVVTAKGDYYFLSNIGLGLKAKYALETITVTGDVNPKYKSMTVDSMKVGAKVVWSKQMQEQMRQQLFPVAPGPAGN
jgi:hypothetical protein